MTFPWDVFEEQIVISTMAKMEDISMGEMSLQCEDGSFFRMLVLSGFGSPDFGTSVSLCWNCTLDRLAVVSIDFPKTTTGEED